MEILILGGGGMAKGIKEVVGGTILPERYCNVARYSEVVGAISEYEPDVVINCAGVSYVSTIKNANTEEWMKDVEVNLLGSFFIASAITSTEYKVKKKRLPTMIFIASVAGLYGKPNHSSYCASKAGVRSLVQSLGMEGHDAYAISPGRVDTPMRERDYPNDTPGSRLKPTDIGGVVKEILEGNYNPGDNIIIRKEGLENIIREVDKGEPWLTKLKVGQPVTI